MPRKMVSFGESMIRFLPVEELPTPLPPSAKQDFVSTIGGDEMNVCLDMSLLGVPTEWVSVLPTNQWGNLIQQSAAEAGVEVSRVRTVEGEVGVFFVLPQLRTVEFQRRHSAFALDADANFDWRAIMDGAGWMHATGITPAIAPGPLRMWQAALERAFADSLPVSLDLNHRPQLGPLDELWAHVRPMISSFQLVILSVGQITGLAALEGYTAALPDGLTDNDDVPWRAVMRWFHARWAGPAVACCFKRRGDGNVQRRWSVLVNGSGECSSRDEPVWHVPKEETGGGSAWAAGFLFGLLGGGESYADPRTCDARAVLRSADLLSAMCQESVGDHSTVRLPAFEAELARAPPGTEAFVGITAAEVPPAMMMTRSAAAGGGGAPAAAPAGATARL